MLDKQGIWTKGKKKIKVQCLVEIRSKAGWVEERIHISEIFLSERLYEDRLPVFLDNLQFPKGNHKLAE